MDDQSYDDVKKYLQTGEIPKNVPSTRGNFIATANKYALNSRGFLTRQNRQVVRISEQEDLYNAFHRHSGRTACWERINAR